MYCVRGEVTGSDLCTVHPGYGALTGGPHGASRFKKTSGDQTPSPVKLRLKKSDLSESLLVLISELIWR